MAWLLYFRFFLDVVQAYFCLFTMCSAVGDGGGHSAVRPYLLPVAWRLLYVISEKIYIFIFYIAVSQSAGPSAGRKIMPFLCCFVSFHWSVVCARAQTLK